MTSARCSPPDRSQPNTRLTTRLPRPIPMRAVSSMKTGSEAPRGPLHRCRGFTISPVTARLPREDGTRPPRSQLPDAGPNPQTCSRTNETNSDVPEVPGPSTAPDRTAAARCLSLCSTRSSSGSATYLRKATSRGPSSSRPEWRSLFQPGMDSPDLVLISAGRLARPIHDVMKTLH